MIFLVMFIFESNNYSCFQVVKHRYQTFLCLEKAKSFLDF